MKKIFLVVVSLSLLASACNKTYLMKDGTVKIKQNTLTVQYADTPATREQGLSGIPEMAESEGMLFLFSQPQSPQFWMKGMLFPLDFIWINGNTIVGISDNAKPEPNVSDDSLTRYAPPSVADKVIEVNAGWTYRHDVNVGDAVTITKN